MSQKEYLCSFVEEKCILNGSSFCNIDHFLLCIENIIQPQEIFTLLEELYPVKINKEINIIEGIDLDYNCYLRLQNQLFLASSTY